jgi:hypothetical protein
MRKSVLQRILRRVSTRDYAGVLGDMCDGNVAERWAGAVPLEGESRFRRIQGYGQSPVLLDASNKILDQEEAAA